MANKGAVVTVVSLCILLCVYYFLYNGNLQHVPTIISNMIKHKHNSSSTLSDLCINNSLSQQHLLAIFTTFKEVPERDYIQTNTIMNWASLGPQVQPVVFTGSSPLDSKLIDTSCQWNWVSHPMLRVNSHGTPFLKDMYRAAKKQVKSQFYGYCNGDILFETGLVDTLSSISRTLQTNKSALVIGRRTNVPIDIRSKTPIYQSDTIGSLSQKHGRLFRLDAEDYFFIWQPQLFPWHTIKDVVVGRPAYDNYLVGQAIKGGVVVVDATLTVLAMHQTGSDGNFAGARNPDSGYNKHIIGRYNYNTGLTTSAQYYTKRNSNNTVELIKR